MMGLEWEFVPGPGRIAAYLRICVSAYLRMCMRGARMQKKRAVKTARFSLLRLISPRDADAGTGSRHG